MSKFIIEIVDAKDELTGQNTCNLTLERVDNKNRPLPGMDWLGEPSTEAEFLAGVLLSTLSELPADGKAIRVHTLQDKPHEFQEIYSEGNLKRPESTES